MKSKKHRIGRSAQKRARFDMADLKKDLGTVKTLTPDQVVYIKQDHILRDITNQFVQCTSSPLVLTENPTLVAPSPVFSPNLTFSFASPPTNP